MAVLCETFVGVQPVSAASSSDNEADKASRDEPISSHKGCELNCPYGLDFQFRFIEAQELRRPVALTASPDSPQNTLEILTPVNYAESIA